MSEQECQACGDSGKGERPGVALDDQIKPENQEGCAHLCVECLGTGIIIEDSHPLVVQRGKAKQINKEILDVQGNPWLAPQEKDTRIAELNGRLAEIARNAAAITPNLIKGCLAENLANATA